MARQAQRNGTTALPEDASDDICPVCKSSRYLNPNMRFLVNPECYHKMCESCVDRIFSHGPAQCPIAGCKKTLRKHRFRKQTFEDIQVEREVDIRRRVAEIFNRREDEFSTLLDYNNYLEEVENITFELIQNINVAENERKLGAYRDANAASIKANAALASNETASLAARSAAEREQAKLRREAARREEEEERREREQGRKQIIDELATGTGNAERIARDGERLLLKKSSMRRAATEAAPSADTTGPAAANGSAGAGQFVIRGLKNPVKTKLEPEKPYDPFGGLRYQTEYYIPTEGFLYEWEWLRSAAEDAAYTAGGYDVATYCQRALTDAFAGLGVFVADEMAAKQPAAPVTDADSRTKLAADPTGDADDTDDSF